MRGVKDEFKTLDEMFRQEDENVQTSTIVKASYSAAEVLNSTAAELAHRRYRKREHRLTTCREMFISESKYYRLLNEFLRIAKIESDG